MFSTYFHCNRNLARDDRNCPPFMGATQFPVVRCVVSLCARKTKRKSPATLIDWISILIPFVAAAGH